MIRIYIITALATVAMLAGLQWRNQVQINNTLAADNDTLRQQITAAETINSALIQRLEDMVNEHNDLQQRIRDAEQRKIVADRENQRLRHEIEQGLKDAPEWATAEIPGSVLAGVRGSIDRLYAR